MGPSMEKKKEENEGFPGSKTGSSELGVGKIECLVKNLQEALWPPEGKGQGRASLDLGWGNNRGCTLAA